MPLPEQDILQTADVLAEQRNPGFETDNLPSPRGFEVPQIAPIPIPGTGQTMDGTGGSQDYLTKFNQSILGTKDKVTPGNLPNFTVEDVFNPRYRSILPGEDSEEAFAKGQSGWAQFGNALVKFGATAVGGFLEGMAAIPSTISAINGNSPYDTAMGNNLDQWKENLENMFPNYYTKWEQAHPFASAIPFSGGFSNFWGDKFVKNLGYTAGAIGSAVLTDVIVGAATGGLGEIPLIGQQIGRAALALNKVFTNTNRAEELLLLGRQAGRTGEQLLNLTKLAQASAATKVANGAKYAVTLYGATMSEAGLEARDAYNTIKRDLQIAYQKEHGYSATGKDLADIESYSRAGGNVRFGANIALLGVSNALQLDGILKTFSAAKAGVRSVIQKELETGAAIGLKKGSLDTFERLPTSLWGKIRPIAPSVLIEGVFEEGGQFATQVAVENFYERKYLYNKKLDKSLYEADETPFDSRDHIGNIVYSVIKGLSDEFSTDEGLENVILGALTGATFGGVTRFMDRNQNKQLTQTTLNLLNSKGVTGVLSNQYDAAATSQRIAEDMKEAAKSNDVFKYKNFQHEQFTNFILSGVRAGRFDVRMEQLDMLKDMSDDEFKKAFGLDRTTDNVRTATEYVEALKDKANKIKRTYDTINGTFTNPFRQVTNPVTKEEALEAKKHKTFEDWKDDLTFLASINADTSERIASIGRDVRTIDPALDQYHVANFTDRAYLKALAADLEKESKGIDNLIKEGVSADVAADKRRSTSLNGKAAEIEIALADAQFAPKKFEDMFGKLLNFQLNGRNDNGPERIPQEAIPKLIEYGKDIHRLRKYRENANKAFDKLSTEEGFNRYFREAEIADEKHADKTEKAKTNNTPPPQTGEGGQPVTTGPVSPKPKPLLINVVKEGKTKQLEKGGTHYANVNGEQVAVQVDGVNPSTKKVKVTLPDGSSIDLEDDAFFDAHHDDIKTEVDANTSVDDVPPNPLGAGTKVGEKKKDISYGLYSTTDPVFSRQDIPFNNFHRRHQNFLFDMGSSDPDVFNQDNKPKLRIIPVTGKTAEALGFPANFIAEEAQPTPKTYKSAEEWEKDNFTKEQIAERRAYGLNPEDEWEPTFRGVSGNEWQSIQNGGTFSSAGLAQGTTFVTPSKDLASASGKGVSAEFIVEFKPEAKVKMSQGDQKLGSQEYYAPGLTLSDVQRVTDKSGKVVYDASRQTTNADNATIRAVYVIDDTLELSKKKRLQDAIVRDVQNSKTISDIIKGQFKSDPEQAISEYYQQAAQSQDTSATPTVESLGKEKAEKIKNAKQTRVDAIRAWEADKNLSPDTLKMFIETAEALEYRVLSNIDKEYNEKVEALQNPQVSSQSSTLNEVERTFGEDLTEKIMEYGSIGLYFSDGKGEKLGRVGLSVDTTKAIFSTFASTDLTFESGTGREERYTNKGKLDEAGAQEWWRQQRANILRDTTAQQAMARTYDFNISRGIPYIINEQSRNSPIAVGLIREADLDKAIITIPTLGDVAVMGAYNEEGEGIASMKGGVSMPPGTPLLNYGGNLIYLNARTFTEAEAKNIFEILKIISDKSRSSETTPLFKYLHKIIHMANLEKKVGATKSSITISGPNLFLGTNLAPIDMNPASLEASKDKIIDFLKTAYHGVKNSEILKIKNDPRSNDLEFPEIVIVDGEITVPRRWKNYNHYLLTGADAPLAVNLAVPQAGERPIIQKYSVIQSFDFDPNKFKVVQAQKPVSTIIDSNSAIQEVMRRLKTLGATAESFDKLRGEYETTTTFSNEEAEYLLGAVEFIEAKVEEAKKQQGEKKAPEQPKEETREVEYIELGGKKFGFTVLARDAQGNITDIEAVGQINEDNSITPFKDKVKDQAKGIILKTLGEGQIKQDETTDPKDDEGLGRGGFRQGNDKYRIFHPGNDNYKRADLTKEFAEVKSILNNDFFKLEKVDAMLKTTGGGLAWGALQDNMIYIYKNAEVGTTYHEAFEAVWYHFVPGIEQQQIYNEFTSRKGEFTTFENKKKNFSDASLKEAKEQLAEEFRDYKLTGKLPKQQKVRTFFQKLLDFIKWLVGIETSDRNRLFKKINKGYYRNFATSLRGPMTSPEYSYYREPGLEQFNETIVQDMLQGMTAETFGRLFGENSSILDQLETDFKTTAGAIYDRLKEDLTKYFEDKVSDIGTLTAEFGVRFQEATRDEDKVAMIAQVKSIRKEWANIKANWESFVREHMRFLRTFNVEFVIDDEGEEHFVDQDDAEDPNKTPTEYGRDIEKIDAKNSASTRVKLLIASIADSEWIREATGAAIDSVRSKRTSSSLALPKLVQYAKLFNYLLHNSSGINGFYGIWDKFTKITDDVSTRKPIDANMRKLMSRVKFDNGFADKSISDWRLILSLENTLTKQKPNFFRQFTDYLRDTYFRTTVLNSKIEQVKASWIAGIKGSTAVRPSAENRFVFSKDVVGVTDPIDFLNRIGIDISRADFRRLRGKRIQKFNDEVNNIRNLIVDAANKGISIPIISSKQIDFDGRLSGLADLYVTYMVGEDTQSQHPNLENEQTSNFILNNFVSTMLNDANESATREEFINKQDNQYFRDVFHEDSILLNKILFDFNTGKKAKAVEVGIVEGRETWDKNNKAASKLTEAERQLYEINNNLNGVFYTLLPADAKTEWAINVGTYLSVNGFFGDSKTRANEISNFSNQMYRWLQTEVLLAQSYETRSFIDNLRRIPKGETRPVGKSLRFFKDILPKDVVDDIHTKVIDGGAALGDVINSDQMRAIMRQYALEKTERTIDNLTDWKVLTPSGKGYKLYGFDKGFLTKVFGKKATYTIEEVQQLVMFREMNYTINAIEMHKFFFGDPAQYKDELKRIKSFLSGREYTHVDQLETNEGFNQQANTILNKTSQTQEGVALAPGDPGYHTFKNHYNTVTLNDIEFESNEIEELRKALGDKAKPYNQGNEDDAGAYMLGTSYRETMWKAGGRFTQAQEDQFQWEMAWERNDKAKDGLYTYSSRELEKHDEELLKKEPDTEVAFPILKLMHSGIQTREDIAIVSLDKASWAPLFYRWYKGKGLGKLYNSMQARGIDYMRMESAHKVGIQKDASMSLYDEKGEINTGAFSTIGIEQIPMKQIGIQVEQAKKEKGQTEGSQLRKIALSDLMENGVPIDFMHEEKDREKAFQAWSNIETDEEKIKVSPIYRLVKRHNEALVNLTLARTQSAMKRMGMIEEGGEMSIPDKKLISDFILSELERRELPRNIAASIQISPETRDFSSPIEANPQYSKIRSIIYSILEKTITRPKVNGGQKTMLSVTGFETGARIVKKMVNGKAVYTTDTLKFYKQGENGTEACEVMLPYWFGKKLMEAGSGRTKEEVLKYLNSTEEGQKLLRGIGFRIPTQGLNSVDFFTVKDFLPEQMGDVVVMPAEITAKAGSDFDIDKLNVYLRNFYIDGKTGFPKVINYQGSEQKTKEHILKLIQEKRISANSVRKDLERYIAEETEGFEEGGLFESIPGAEELFGNDRLIEDFLKDKEINVLNMYYQKTLENEYFDSIEGILALPENFSRLIQPNDASELKGYRNKILELKGASTSPLGEYGKLLDSTFMMQERQAYMSSKQVVGISAVSQTAHAIGQNIQGGLVITDPEIEARFDANMVDGKISLSGLTTHGGDGLISNINSQTTDGGVDVARDKFLAEMGVNQDTLSTFLTLVRMGAKPYWATLFLNQPAVQRFLKLKAISSSVSQINPAVVKENDKDLVAKVMKEFGGTNLAIKEKMEQPSKYTIKEMEEMLSAYSNNPTSLTNKQKVIQMMMLNDFRTYNSLSWDLFHLYQGYNWDTARVNDPNLVRLKKLKYEKANNLSVTSAYKVMSDTFIGEMRDQIIKLDDALRSIINVQHGAAGEILDEMARRVFNMRGGEAVKLQMLNNIELSAIDYATQTGAQIDGRPLNSLIPLLLTSKRPVAEYVLALKNYADDKKISENLFIKGLVPNIDKRQGYPSVVLMPERDYDTYTSNVLTDSFRELKNDTGVVISIDDNQDNDRTVAQIYKRLVLLSILQGGVKSGKGQFVHLIPSETYTEFVRDSLTNMNLEGFVENLVIYRTGWNNPALVPHAEPEYLDERDEFEGVPPVYLSMQVPQIINTLAKVMNVKPEQVPRILTPKAWISRGSKVMQIEEMERDPVTKQVINRKVRLFRRVDVETNGGTWPLQYGNTKRLLFVEINAWGDPNIKEYYKDASPSVLPHNNKVIEVGDQEILYALLEANVQTNAAEFVIGETIAKFEEQEGEDMDESGNETPDSEQPTDPFFQVDSFEEFKNQLKRKNC